MTLGRGMTFDSWQVHRVVEAVMFIAAVNASPLQRDAVACLADLPILAQTHLRHGFGCLYLVFDVCA